MINHGKILGEKSVNFGTKDLNPFTARGPTGAQGARWLLGRWLAPSVWDPVTACDPALAQNRGNDLGRAYYSMYIDIIYI